MLASSTRTGSRFMTQALHVLPCTTSILAQTALSWHTNLNAGSVEHNTGGAATMGHAFWVGCPIWAMCDPITWCLASSILCSVSQTHTHAGTVTATLQPSTTSSEYILECNLPHALSIASGATPKYSILAPTRKAPGRYANGGADTVGSAGLSEVLLQFREFPRDDDAACLTQQH